MHGETIKKKKENHTLDEADFFSFWQVKDWVTLIPQVKYVIDEEYCT